MNFFLLGPQTASSGETDDRRRGGDVVDCFSCDLIVMYEWNRTTQPMEMMESLHGVMALAGEPQMIPNSHG